MSYKHATAVFVLAAIFLSGMALGVGFASAGGKGDAPDPDEGRPMDDVRADHAANSSVFFERYRVWVDELNAGDLDLRALPSVETFAIAGPPLATLDQAREVADLIVFATVSDVQFRGSHDSLIHLDIIDTAKGQPRAQVTVASPVFLVPTEAWEPQLGLVEGYPMVYPGEKAIFFLSSMTADPASFTLMPWTGTYRTDGDRLVADSGSPFARSVEALSPEAFLELIRSDP